MTASPRERFLSYVRDHRSARRVVSPFLPHPEVIAACLRELHLPAREDEVANEISSGAGAGLRADVHDRLFGADLRLGGRSGEIRPRRHRQDDPDANGEWVVSTRPARISPGMTMPDAPSGHSRITRMLVSVCERGRRSGRTSSATTSAPGAAGSATTVSWSSVTPTRPGWGTRSPRRVSSITGTTSRDVYQRSMEAVAEASLVRHVHCHGGGHRLHERLELRAGDDLSRALSDDGPSSDPDSSRRGRTSVAGSSGITTAGSPARLIQDGTFDTLGADLIETIAPPPEGDNDLAASRRSWTAGSAAREISTSGSCATGRPRRSGLRPRGS